MIAYENHCVGCDIPCINCGLKHVPVCRCDICDMSEDSLHEYDDKQLCDDCIENLISVFYDEEREVYDIDGEEYENASDFIDTLYEVTIDDYIGYDDY